MHFGASGIHRDEDERLLDAGLGTDHHDEKADTPCYRTLRFHRSSPERRHSTYYALSMLH
jgi:hypothetical protein